MPLADIYLVQLYRRNKSLFYIACLFIAGTLMPVIINFEITPFFDWRMYAYPATPKDRHPVYVLHYNNKVYNEPHTWKDHSRMMFTYTIAHYCDILEQGDTLPFYTKTSRILLGAFAWNQRDNRLHMNNSDLAQYPAWLKRYIRQQVREPLRRIQVERVWVRYDDRNHVMPVATENIFTR